MRGGIGQGRLAPTARCLCALALLAPLATSCGQPPGAPVVTVPGGDPGRGRDLVEVYACGSCHVAPRVLGADAMVGPPLTGFAERAYIAGELPNTPYNVVRWIVNPRAIKPNTAMPSEGVTDREARDLTAFLYTLR